MLLALCLAFAAIACGEHLNEIDSEAGCSDDIPAGTGPNIGCWPPAPENEILGPAVDINRLGERLRKSVRLLKANNKLEIIFVIDSSSSIGEANYKSELKFIQKLVADFNVGPKDTRVAVVAYASTARTHVNHLEHDGNYEKCTLLHLELPRMEYTGGNTNTIEALLEARRIFRKSRPEAGKALFLVTDGFSNKGDPIPTAKELKESGIRIFTFGIQTGNVHEIRAVSSEPIEDHSFVLGSFSEFEALARRALHEDLKAGQYVTLNDTGLCNGLCARTNPTSDTGCCNDRSLCSCGILTGHFACLCPPGYYGTGLIEEECRPCPNGTFHDGSTPGDVLVCLPCPDSNHATKIPATKANDCFCREGYTSVDDKCEVVTCPSPSPPANGYFVKKNCSNVVHAACGVRCSTGYKLRGQSVRICQSNGNWSGVPPICEPKSCKRPAPIRDSVIVCKNEDYGLESTVAYDSKGHRLRSSVKKIDCRPKTSEEQEEEVETSAEGSELMFNYTVDTVCTFRCLPGYIMIGSKARTCLPILKWNGLATSCTVIKCPPLPTLKNGFVKPDNCTVKGLKHGFATECSLSCDSGYRLEGPSLRNCTGRRGTWTGKNVPSKCIDVEPPVFECPENVTTETAAEESYALVRLSLPQGTDNSGIEPIIWSKPPFLPDYPLPLKIGTTKIEVYATDASDNGDFCAFYVTVEDKEIPKIYNCESPPTFYLSDIGAADMVLNWTEPFFTDNSAIPLEVEKSHDYGIFPLGTTSVLYVARDASGNAANCTLNITVEENPCSDRPVLGNVLWNCSVDSSIMKCVLSCPAGLTWTTTNDFSGMLFMCQYDRNGARWHPDVFSDLDAIPECSTFELPTEIVESHEIELDGKDILCEDTESLSREMRNELNFLLGTEEATRISIEADCVDEDAQNPTAPEDESNDIAARKKRAADRKRVKVRVSLIGRSSDKTSTDEAVKHLQELGQKVEKEYNKNSFINIGGKRVKVQNTKTTGRAKLRCNAGFVLKRGLCVKCPPGTFHDSARSSCTPCPIGKYQSLEGQSDCVSCPAGYLTRKRRRKQQNDCKKICPPGTFGKIRGQRKQKTSLAPCIPCPIGSYQSERGQSSCIECPEDKTTARKGSARAEQCIDKSSADDPCYSFACKNNGTCFVYNGFPSCLCAEGFLGSFCEKRKNYCDSSPCYNDGECIPTGATTYECKCREGYEGDLCQFETDECASNPCENGADCVDLFSGYKCECLPGFGGTNCETDIDECEIFAPCLNNGTCKDLVNGYSCTCPEGYSGKHCEEVSECILEGAKDEDCNANAAKSPEHGDPCSKIVCPMNTECSASSTSNHLPICRCREGFYGKNCSEEINFNVILTFPKRSVTEYIAADFPAIDLHQITVCLWIQTTDAFNYGTLFSYAVRDEDNTFTVTDYKGFVLYVNKERVVTDVVANDGHWHFICIVWESEDGHWEIYLDGKNQINGTGLSKKSPIPGGGRFIIGQEQDLFGAGFSEIESFVGKITHFDIWNRNLGKDEIEDMNENCRYFQGNLFSWVRFLENIHGDVQIAASNFCTNCNARQLRLFRGRVTIQNVRDSTYGVYECDRGYRISFEGDEDEEAEAANDLNVWYRKCLKHGDWEPVVPTCKRVNCFFPGYFPHGTMTGNSYLFSDVIEYQCNAGYSLVGNATRQCLENGTWSGDQPSCEGSTGFCEEITAPLHGSMFTYFGSSGKVSKSSIGDKAEFICDEGYRLEGADNLTCSEGGFWDDEVPRCIQVPCPFPNESEAAVTNSTTLKTFAVGEVLVVECLDSGNERLIECQQNGSWTYSYATGPCRGKCEGRPKQPEHGLLTGDPLKYVFEAGELIHVKCRFGYRLTGDDFFKCSSNGTWQQTNGTTCQPIECIKPIPPPHSYVSSTFTNYPYGRRILFRCLPGYRQQGDLLTRCDENGKWTIIFGQCVGT